VLQHDAMHPIEPQVLLATQHLPALPAAGNRAKVKSHRSGRSIGMEPDRKRD
jgi:hypothetical protein